jgi:hypothetical protein
MINFLKIEGIWLRNSMAAIRTRTTLLPKLPCPAFLQCPTKLSHRKAFRQE